MAFSICYWANYTQGKTKLSRKSENAVADDRVLKFLYDADLRHVEYSVRCHRKYKNGPIKDLGKIIFIYLHALYRKLTQELSSFVEQ